MSDFLTNWANETDENKRLVAEERLILDVTESIWGVMEKNDISNTELASRLNKSKAFVSQLLQGSRNMTLRTLADIAHVLNHRVKVEICDTNQSQLWTNSTKVSAIAGCVPVEAYITESANVNEWSSGIPVQLCP